MELNDRFSLYPLERQQDDFGGFMYVETDNKKFWGALSFVTAKDSPSKRSGRPTKNTKKALYKIIVRRNFELPNLCTIHLEKRQFMPISDCLSCDRNNAFSSFYVEEITSA